MNLRLLQIGRRLLAALAIGSALLVTGCSTVEPDNHSARPWNSPKGWENGVPGFQGLTNDRR